MTTFQKPQALKAALKMALYGPAGSGKTFTALLIAEGLARHTAKRIAYVDTEYGTAFYGQAVPQRKVHPDAFDFEVCYSKSITQVLDAVRGIDPGFGVLIVDSISHLWDACKAAYTGRLTRAGTVPLSAWAAIKRPYRELMHLLLASPIHVLICGRQGIDFGEDEDSTELKNMGFRMRAEGETAYEPDLLIRLESHKENRKTATIPVAHVEKDRTGVLAGQTISWPKYDNVAQPLLGLLGTTQAALPSEAEVGIQDAEALARQDREHGQRSAELAGQYTSRMMQAGTIAELQQIGGELKPAVKQLFVAKDLARVRNVYVDRLANLRPGKDDQRVRGEAGEPTHNGG
jgi:hypothetical protein